MGEAYSYAVWRVVPDLVRGEALNAGVVLFSRRHRFLGARVAVDPARLAVLAPALDPAPVQRALDVRLAVADGDAERGGPPALMDPSDRFGFLVAPASTVVQPGPVHTGVCDDPVATLDRLLARLVLPPG